jgi:hypothetical protein
LGGINTGEERNTFEKLAKGLKKNNWRDESGASRVLKCAAYYTLSGARKVCTLSLSWIK